MGAGFSIKAKGNAEADIYIYEDVGAGWFGGVTAKQFADDLNAIGNVSTINLRINSYGGDVFDGLAMYRLLVDHKAKVITHIDGIAASIASVIAMAGSEIIIGESAQIMIHDAWGLAMGNADEMRKMGDLLDMTTGSIADVYTGRTKADRKDVRKWMSDETWMVGQEAVDKGFADRVVENMKVAARFDPQKHKFRRAPANLGTVSNTEALRERLAQMRNTMERRRPAA